MTQNLGEIHRVLVVGKDARSDAILAACGASQSRPELFAYSEFLSPGFLEKCQERVYTGDLRDVDKMTAYATEIRPDIAIVGPEEPLAAGIVDKLEAAGIPCFGPYRDLAQIETSKAWARQLLAKHRIPGNPEHRVFASLEGMPEFLNGLGPFVVKPDGLTGGKGVRVFGEHLHSIDEALRYSAECFPSHGKVVIEEKLEGEEFSLQSITDGEMVRHCPLAQDHKRAFNGDEGPNTGGMGSYSCADFSLPFLEPSDVEQAKLINEAVIQALRKETGRPYRGVLYGNFMVTKAGVRVVEYNARFADPEAMNVLPILDSDFLEICQALINGTLSQPKVQGESDRV